MKDIDISEVAYKNGYSKGYQDSEDKHNQIVTNRDKLRSLPSGELVRWILYEAPEIGKLSISSESYLTEWLDSPYEGWITIHERSELIMNNLNSNE